MIASLMKFVAVLIGVGFVLFAVGVAFVFGTAQSSAEMFGVPMWGAIAGLAAAALPTLPFLWRNAWISRRWGALVACAVLLVLFGGFTLAGSFGFGATSRSVRADSAQGVINKRADGEKEVQRLRGLIAGLPAHATEEAIKARLAELRKRPKANADKIVGALEELGHAERERELNNQLLGERERLPAEPPTRTADPQAKGLSRLSGEWLSEDEIRDGVSGWLAVLLDLGATLILYVTSTPGAMPTTPPAKGANWRRRWAELLESLKPRDTNVSPAADANNPTRADATSDTSEREAETPVFATVSGDAELSAVDGVSGVVFAAVSEPDEARVSNVIAMASPGWRIAPETVAAFIASHCETGAGLSVASADIASAFARAHGLASASPAHIGRALADLGYGRHDFKDGNGRRSHRGWAGLALSQSRSAASA